MKIYIPKNKKIVSKKQSVDIISKFEINIFKDYNSGKIPYPIHLSKGNKQYPTEIIFKTVLIHLLIKFCLLLIL